MRHHVDIDGARRALPAVAVGHHYRHFARRYRVADRVAVGQVFDHGLHADCGRSAVEQDYQVSTVLAVAGDRANRRSAVTDHTSTAVKTHLRHTVALVAHGEVVLLRSSRVESLQAAVTADHTQHQAPAVEVG